MRSPQLEGRVGNFRHSSTLGNKAPPIRSSAIPLCCWSLHLQGIAWCRPSHCWFMRKHIFWCRCFASFTRCGSKMMWGSQQRKCSLFAIWQWGSRLQLRTTIGQRSHLTQHATRTTCRTSTLAQHDIHMHTVNDGSYTWQKNYASSRERSIPLYQTGKCRWSFWYGTILSDGRVLLSFMNV